MLRGTFVLKKPMCFNIELPTGFTPVPPDPYSGKTARERFSQHSASQVCAGCHKFIDPLGSPFENYDAVGQYRASERWTNPMTNMTYDTPIDANGAVPNVPGTATNAVELVQLLANSTEAETASRRTGCVRLRPIAAARRRVQPESVADRVPSGGYNVEQLLLALTQSDGFLYCPAQRRNSG